jgi:WD40 repeat protein
MSISRLSPTLICIFFILSVAFSHGSGSADQAGQLSSDVDFGRDIAPILAKNCVACHNTKKPEGGLNLESHSSLMQGGDSGSSVEPGVTEDGYLLQRILDDDDPMPPDNNAVGAKRLTGEEVAQLRRWIELGALPPEKSHAQTIQWQPLPDGIQPIYALAASPDGNYLAVGRGNTAFVIRNSPSASNPQSFPLIDPIVGETLRQNQPTSVLEDDSEGKPKVQATHLDMVHSIAFSPDSQLIATGGYRCVKIWERTTTAAETIESAMLGLSESSRVAFSRTGQRLAVATASQLEVLDLERMSSHRFLRTQGHPIAAFEWLEDEAILLLSDSAGNFMLFDAESRLLEAINGEALPVLQSLVSLDSGQLVGVNREGALQLLHLDRETRNLVAGSILPFNGVISVLRFPRDGQKLAASFQDGLFRIIDVDAATVDIEFQLGDPTQLAAISPDGQLIAGATNGGPTMVWKTEDGTKLTSLERDYLLSQQLARAAQDTIRQQGLIKRLETSLADLGKIVEAEEAATVKVQEVRDKAAEDLSAKEAELGLATQAVTEAESLLAQAEAALQEAMKLVEQRKTELETKQKVAVEANGKKQSAVDELSKREQALATARDATQRAQARIPLTENNITAETQRLTELQQRQQTITDATGSHPIAREIVFANDGEKIVLADDLGRLHVFSSHSGNPEAILQLDSPATALAVNGDQRLISLSRQGVAQFWDLNLSWKLKHTIGHFLDSPFSDRITALDFNPDGTRLAVGSGPASRYGEIHLVDPASGQLTNSFGEVHSDSVFALKFSPNGRWLASGAADKIVRVFDVETGQQTVTLEGHTHHVLAISWNDDCATLATASADNSLKIWDVESGTQKRTVGGFKREVTAIGYVGQSNQVLTVDASGTAQLIDSDNGKQIRSFPGASGPLLSIGINPINAVFYAGGQSGQQWGWQIEDGKPIQ